MGKLIKTPTSESELTLRRAKNDASVKIPEIVKIALIVALNCAIGRPRLCSANTSGGPFVDNDDDKAPLKKPAPISIRGLA